MRKKFLLFCHKLDWRFCRLYTWLWRSSLKSCGENVAIYYPVRLENPGSISLGSGTLLYPRTWLNVVSEWAGVKYHGEIQIGNRVSISYGVQISAAESIIIEDEVALAAGVVIVDHIHGHLHLDMPVFRAPLSKPSPVRIGRNAFLGAFCFIGPGVQIGEHAVVSANAVVVNDVPPYAIAVGNPARSVRYHNPDSSNAAVAELRGGFRVPDLPTIAATSTVEAVDPVTTRPSSRLFSNSIAMGAANLLSRGLGYGYFILMARRLDSRYVGTYAILVTSALLVELLSSLGLDKILIREIASNPAAEGKGYFWAALPIRFAMAVFSAAGAWVLLLMFFKDSFMTSRLTSAVFLAAIFPILAAKNCEAFLTAHECLLPIAVAQLSERVVFFGATLLLFWGAISFDGLLCFAPLASLVRLAIVAWRMARIWEHDVPSKPPNQRRLIGQASELFSVEILAQAYFRSDVFVLAKLGGLRETGIYQITYKIFDCCLSLFTGFLQAAYPRLVRDRSRRSLEVMLAWGTGLLAIPVAIIILGRHLILGAVSSQYLSGSTSLVWLMLTVPLVYVTTTLANATIAAGRVRILIVLAAVLLVTNLGLNLILIPKWSINGAAFSTFACELLSAAVLGPFVLKKLALSK